MIVLNDMAEFVDVESKYREWDWDLELFITTLLEESADGDVEPVLAEKIEEMECNCSEKLNLFILK